MSNNSKQSIKAQGEAAMTAQILKFTKQGKNLNESGFTIVPHWLWTKKFTPNEIAVLTIVYRYTWGYSKNRAEIAHSTFLKHIDISKNVLIKSISTLEQSQIIRVHRSSKNGGKLANSYEIINNNNNNIESYVVQNLNHPSAESELPLVQNLNHPSAESEHNKENLKESNKENLKERVSEKTKIQDAAQQRDYSPATQSAHVQKAKPSKCKNNNKSEKLARAESVVTLYHDALPELPRVAKLTDKRISAINARFSEDLPTLADWQAYFAQVANSAFLTGRSGKFRANLEWLINPNNFVKVAEGNYNQSFATTAPQRPQPRGNFANSFDMKNTEWLDEVMEEYRQEREGN